MLKKYLRFHVLESGLASAKIWIGWLQQLSCVPGELSCVPGEIVMFPRSIFEWRCRTMRPVHQEDE